VAPATNDWRKCNADLVDSISGKPFSVTKIMSECKISKNQANELLNGLKLKVLINALRSVPSFNYLDTHLSYILDAMDKYRTQMGFKYLPVKFNTKTRFKLKHALKEDKSFNKIVNSLKVHDFINLLVKNSLWKAAADYRTYVCGIMNYLKITKKKDKTLLKLVCPNINQPLLMAPTHRQGIKVNEQPQLFLSASEVKSASVSDQPKVSERSTRSTSKEFSSLHGFNTTSLSPKRLRSYATNVTA
jgi:hypothetical protein